MFSNQNSAEFSILTDLNGYIQQLLDITRLADASISNPNVTTIQDRNPSLLKICYCVETILSNGLKDVNFLSSTVMWDFLQNLPQCLPDTGRIIELSKDCSKTSIGRGRILIRLALNDGCLDEYISALCFSEGILKSYYKDSALLRNSEFLGLFQGLISMLSHIQFSLVVKDKDLDKPTYWNDIALTLLTNVDRQQTRTRIVEKEIFVEKEKEVFIEKIVEREVQATGNNNNNDNNSANTTTTSSMVSSESTLSLEELESVLSEITSTSLEDEQTTTTTTTTPAIITTTTTTTPTPAITTTTQQTIDTVIVTLPPPIPEHEIFTISENDFKRWDLIIDGLSKAKKKVILDFGAKGSALTMADTNGCLELLWGSIDKFLSNDIRIVTDSIENLWDCISNISTSDDGVSNNVQKEIVSNIELMYSDQFKRIRAFYYRGIMSHSSFSTYLSQFYQYQDTVQHSLLIRYYKKSSIVMQLDYMVKFFEILTDLTNTVTFRLKWDKDVLSLIEPKQPKKTMVTKIIKKKIIVKKTIPKKELEQQQQQQEQQEKERLEKERLEKEQADKEYAEEQLKLQQITAAELKEEEEEEEVDLQIEDLQSILNSDETPKELITNLSNSIDGESIKSYQSGSNSGSGSNSNNGSNNNLVEKEILVGEEEEENDDEQEQQKSLLKELEQRKKEQDEIEKLEILVHSRPLPERKSTLTEVLKKEKEMFSASLANNNNNTATLTSSSSNEDDVNSEHFQNLLSSLKSSQEPMEFRYQSNPTYSSYTDSYNNEPFSSSYMGGASSLTDDKSLLKSSSSIDYHMISDYFNDNDDDDSPSLSRSSSNNGATRNNNGSYKSVKKNKNLLIGEDGQLFNNTLYRSSMIKSKYSVQGVCPGCHIQLEKLGFFKTRICYYTGKYYCNNCHSNQKSLIPSRILWHWDFKLYSVCDSAKSYITRNYSNPFDIFQFNPESIQLSTRLAKILSMRTKLHFIGEYIESCRNKVTLEGTIPQLNDYFVSGNVNLYSLSDLEKVNNGNQLELTIQEVMEKYIDHISNACIICKGKGFICEFCDSDELIFSWMSLDSVNYSKCDKCFTLSHKKCFSKDRCPKCIRISRVKTASSSSTSAIKSNSVQLQIK